MEMTTPTIHIPKRAQQDGNLYLFPDSSLFPNDIINLSDSQSEPIHDIYTVKGPYGEIQRIHYAVDEYGLRANIHSNSARHGSTIDKDSMQSEPKRWPLNDFDFALKNFISPSYPKNQNISAFSNFVQTVFNKPSVSLQDSNDRITNQARKLRVAGSILPSSITSKRLYANFVSNEQKQFPYAGEIFETKTSSTINAENENIEKYQAPPKVSSLNYIRNSQTYPAKGFFESQHIIQPIVHFNHQSNASFNTFTNNGSMKPNKNLTDLLVIKPEGDENNSQTKVEKSSLNKETQASSNTISNHTEIDEHIISQNVQKESSLKKSVFALNQTEKIAADTRSNVTASIHIQPVLNDYIPRMKTQPDLVTLTSSSFKSAPLSTIFDSSSDEGGPYYHYVMNIGKNFDDVVDKYFTSNSASERINEDKKNILSVSTKNVSENEKDVYTFNNITNDILELNEDKLTPHVINNSTHFTNSDLNTNLEIIYPKNDSNEIRNNGTISSVKDIHNISKIVKEEIMEIVNDQELLLPSVLTNIDNVQEVIPIHLDEIVEIMSPLYFNESSLNQTANALEKQIQEFNNNDSTIDLKSINSTNSSRDIISANTTVIQFLNIPDKNLISHKANYSKLANTIFPFASVFTDSMKHVPEIFKIDQTDGLLINSRKEEINGTFRTIPETPSSFHGLNSQGESIQILSTEIYGNNSVNSNSFHQNKSITNIMAASNSLSPADEIHNGISNINSSKKEGRHINSDVRNSILKMIPKVKMNDFLTKINNTLASIRILHPKNLVPGNISHFTIQDGNQNFSWNDFEQNSNTNFNDNFSNHLDMIQGNIERNNTFPLLKSSSYSKTAELESINNSIDENLTMQMAKDIKRNVSVPAKSLDSDLFDNEINLKNTSLFQKESETLSNAIKSAFVNTENQKSRYKSRTKVKPLDINDFQKLLHISQSNDMSNVYEAIEKIATALSGEDFESQKIEVKDFGRLNNLDETDIAEVQDNRFKNIDDLASSIQYIVVPFEDLENNNTL
ncbi:hypothetical protein HNY73_009564 [Argiope bruennichi]|uniref:Uncharacterized protein n=1 Tax=Argiope bruennichi TaxID=94029 RepID=A0A8T0FA20_ARGBR|nr:hypothetical protein HNY73_009564 [Argiope bruennichi]